MDAWNFDPLRPGEGGAGGQFRTMTSDKKPAAWLSYLVERAGDGGAIAVHERLAVERQRTSRNL